MNSQELIPSDIEQKWVAYLNIESVFPPVQDDDNDVLTDIEHTWTLAGTSYCFNNSDTDKAWSGVEHTLRLSAIKRTKIVYNFLRYAAVIIIMLGIGWTAYFFSGVKSSQPIEIASITSDLLQQSTAQKPLDITTVNLPDGSVVKMNANSTLKYPAAFEGNQRVVYLTGEAFFKVTPDASHPFIVKMYRSEVEVLGTSFNISAYPGKGSVEVNVATGKIKFSTEENNQQAILSAGINGVYSSGEKNIVVGKKLSDNYNAWMTKMISFHRTPLKAVFEDLENVYHVNISFNEPRIGNILYTANFADNSFDYILEVIAQTHHLSVQKTDGSVLFSSIAHQ